MTNLERRAVTSLGLVSRGGVSFEDPAAGASAQAVADEFAGAGAGQVQQRVFHGSDLLAGHACSIEIDWHRVFSFVGMMPGRVPGWGAAHFLFFGGQGRMEAAHVSTSRRL
ncbi:hypothetical protein [Bifidobacterium simiarum]|uniref:hypothetical protein n=1 Tax=Bifidobacterium simiarum TaxID=2045441 RepID=UPI001BDCA561|nr:hypothetical protein [Bifidobacterium simiarum]MBT1167008.1 hypothetical protein [Bifidobacterium simiarum]